MSLGGIPITVVVAGLFTTLAWLLAVYLGADHLRGRDPAASRRVWGLDWAARPWCS